MDELKDAFGASQILEAMFTQVAQGRPLWQLVDDKSRRGRRQQHLAAVAGRHDPRGPVETSATSTRPASMASCSWAGSRQWCVSAKRDCCNPGSSDCAERCVPTRTARRGTFTAPLRHFSSLIFGVGPALA